MKLGTVFKKGCVGSKEMSKLLKIFAAFGENCGLIPSTHWIAHNSLYLQFQKINVLFWHLWIPGIQKDMQAYTHKTKTKTK